MRYIFIFILPCIILSYNNVSLADESWQHFLDAKSKNMKNYLSGFEMRRRKTVTHMPEFDHPLANQIRRKKNIDATMEDLAEDVTNTSPENEMYAKTDLIDPDYEYYVDNYDNRIRPNKQDKYSNKWKPSRRDNGPGPVQRRVPWNYRTWPSLREVFVKQWASGRETGRILQETKGRTIFPRRQLISDYSSNNDKNTDESKQYANRLHRKLRDNDVKELLGKFAMKKRETVAHTPLFDHPSLIHNNKRQKYLSVARASLEGDIINTGSNDKNVGLKQNFIDKYENIVKYNPENEYINDVNVNEHYNKMVRLLNKQEILTERLKISLRDPQGYDFFKIIESVERKKRRNDTKKSPKRTVIQEVDIHRALNENPLVRRILKIARRKFGRRRSGV